MQFSLRNVWTENSGEFFIDEDRKQIDLKQEMERKFLKIFEKYNSSVIIVSQMILHTLDALLDKGQHFSEALRGRLRANRNRFQDQIQWNYDLYILNFRDKIIDVPNHLSVLSKYPVSYTHLRAHET